MAAPFNGLYDCTTIDNSFIDFKSTGTTTAATTTTTPSWDYIYWNPGSQPVMWGVDPIDYNKITLNKKVLLLL